VSFKHPVVILVLAILALGGGFMIGRISSASRISTIQPVDSDGSLSDSDGASSNSNGTRNSDSSAAETAVKIEDLVPRYQLSERTDHPPIDDTEEEAYVQWMVSHTGAEESVLRERWQRSQACKTLYETPDLSKPRVIEAFLMTPREIFARDSNRDRAYDNAALPIGWGQTISGPHMVSRMTESIDPQHNHRVLEIGTGSGYQAAVLAQLSNFIFTIEIVRPLALQTKAIVERLYSDYPEYKNIRFKIADGYYGWEQYAPFHRIIVTAGIDHIPPALLKQLAPEGIMVIPVGPPSGQTVLKVTKQLASDGQITLTREDVYRGTSRGNIIFVPFTDSSGEKHRSK
jgi:protein-L-isoaspartate(D-aspartate) O-methyltransferase